MSLPPSKKQLAFNVARYMHGGLRWPDETLAVLMRNGFIGHPAVQKAIEEVHRAAGTVALEIEGLITQAETHWQKDMLLKFCRLLEMAKPNVFKGSDKPLPVKYGRPCGAVVTHFANYSFTTASGVLVTWKCYGTLDGRLGAWSDRTGFVPEEENVLSRGLHLHSSSPHDHAVVRLYDAWLASQASPASSTPPGTASLPGSLDGEP
jgi:hypothetical protein